MLDVTYNGSKIIDSEEVTPPVTVTYNGSTIATLNAGDTKTLDILGSDNKPKILSTPIVIGGKIIPDVDALGRKWVLEHNLEVEVGGVTLINFTIEGAIPSSFQAEEGMTWNQWVASSYNPNGYFITYEVPVPGGYEIHVKPNSGATNVDVYVKNGRVVTDDQTIIPNGEYTLGGGY